ncbi:hypothetical protein SAMN02746041_01469 [Desulfacinum hydrothermale DSM 13146]|uniref:S-adenosyl-l-methionine hydroxide adenosyltransferase n=1 Tax=Desulfacinum hydrothermale DSM 13146 TaxID=1121390 RepID=A0A1W1XEI3_9BACT|nr:SAM-dependent chlorinase/fluorinase [Desulfacinum hydrothermale]SMC22455.1 hypothetical protein SAMN02746041_01469 [Desulfacinum hydrothermale DSM 13146]
MEPIITLLTDFGLQDGYVASMKGVLLTIAPRTRIVDITHLIPPQDIRWGSYVLNSSYTHFPPGTVHVAVVDPGVGTDRRAIAIRTEHHLFVGPDNGLFSFVLDREESAEARLLKNASLFRPTISSTFHGRDVFAPAAAHLASGIPFASLGPSVEPLVGPWVRPNLCSDALEGEVLGSDRFGNIVTNIQQTHLAAFARKKAFLVFLEDQRIPVFASTYDELPPGHPLALMGSSGHLEISVNQGNAAHFYKARGGQKVRVVRVD